MRLSIRHTTRYGYDPAPLQAGLRLRLFPPVTGAQEPIDWRVSVNGTVVTPMLTDAAGDQVGQWHAQEEISEIVVVAEGTVETVDTSGVLTDLDAMMSPGVMLRTTALTEPDSVIAAFADRIEGETEISRLHALSDVVHKAVTYQSGQTTAETTAIDAARAGAGVCQDQAHVFVAAARSMGIPARYVAGYLFDPDGTAGAGNQTHAWAEAHIQGLGWVGFDVTNQVCPTEAYVRISCGLDAIDAAPIRGVLTGAPEETMTTEVAIAQATGQSQQ